MYQAGNLILVSYLSIRAGSSNYSIGGSEHKVSRFDIHPLYDSFLLDYDASILTLMSYIKFDLFRKPVKLPYLNEPFLIGTSASTSGWGRTENETISNVLLMVELQIVDQVECFKVHEADGGVTTRMICAASQLKDSCNGGKKYFVNFFFAS